MTDLLSLSGLTKAYPGVVANDEVSFSSAEGEIHALLGENGAGKSTLVSILYGFYTADSGIIEISGKPAVIRNSADAIAEGDGTSIIGGGDSAAAILRF